MKPAPDIARLVAESPHLVTVRYRGKTYKWATCKTCQKQFWKDYCANALWISDQHKVVYCSWECKQTGYRVLNKLRQRRYQKRRRAGLVGNEVRP